MKNISFTLILLISFCVIVSQGETFTYQWEIDETPEGSESATVVEPIEVTLLDEQIQVPSHSASLALMRKYSVHLGPEWDPGFAYRLLQTFESIPQETNSLYADTPGVAASIWRLSDRHIQDDISVEYRDGQRIVTIAEAAFVHATPLLAEIEGVRGRYFSKRLHHAVVRFVTDNGVDRHALERILRERYAVSINVPDYAELTQYTTGEHAGRFSEFKNEEILAIIPMLEEFPTGMLKIPGLKYLVRRLDGTLHPTHPSAPAVAWPSEGYIEFMESAFKDQSLEYIHRLIIHEKSHFMWFHLFDEQLKQDWIEIGGWYENLEDPDGWSTTKQTEFVSAYAHGKNPNEDMAESISYYIVTPDKLRSRSPAKYEFIQNRIMHGTRYISQIREDLTFEVYNLYPDYIYPGKIIGLKVEVIGEPEKDKIVIIDLELHSENKFDKAYGGYVRIHSEKPIYVGTSFYPVDANGNRVNASHLLRSYEIKMSKFAPSGYWVPEQIELYDANKNERYSGISDFGWGMYIDNPLADCEPPEYVANSLRLSLRKSTDQESSREGGEYQVLTASWLVEEKNDLKHVSLSVNDESEATYSRQLFNYGNKYKRIENDIIQVSADLEVPDYHVSGIYKVVYLSMRDIAGNPRQVFFTGYSESDIYGDRIGIEEKSPTIQIDTLMPDTTPLVLDLNDITIRAEPTNPEAPNGETNVYVTFRVKDDISGYSISNLYLRDPLGVIHREWHWISNRDYHRLYFDGDPTVYTTYHKTILLPVGSVPGTWGLAEMTVYDKARNVLHADFTEIVRFEVDDGSLITKSDVNKDGTINVLDLILVASEIANPDTTNNEIDADINDDGVVNILDMIEVASNLGAEIPASPNMDSITAEQLQRWIAEARILDDGSYAFKLGMSVLETLLLTMRPETTVLLANYPNPFNPETWIPYQLANASDVQITIYDMKGVIVRTLDLGHQAAGYYTHRSRAVYWDGRNGLGEPVASGVYFYQLQAANVSHLRKMVILK